MIWQTEQEMGKPNKIGIQDSLLLGPENQLLINKESRSDSLVAAFRKDVQWDQKNTTDTERINTLSWNSGSQGAEFGVIFIFFFILSFIFQISYDGHKKITIKNVKPVLF